MSAVIILLVIWEIYWKGHALWIAAQKKDKNFFIAILIINSIGILFSIYYLCLGFLYLLFVLV